MLAGKRAPFYSLENGGRGQEHSSVQSENQVSWQVLQTSQEERAALTAAETSNSKWGLVFI